MNKFCKLYTNLDQVEEVHRGAVHRVRRPAAVGRFHLATPRCNRSGWSEGTETKVGEGRRGSRDLYEHILPVLVVAADLGTRVHILGIRDKLKVPGIRDNLKVP